MRTRILEAKLMTNGQVDQLLADFQSPELHAITSIHCYTWGRKPA